MESEREKMEREREEEAEKEMLAWLASDEAKEGVEAKEEESDEEEVDWTGFNEDYEKHRDEYKALIVERLFGMGTAERKQYDENLNKEMAMLEKAMKALATKTLVEPMD